MLCGISFNLSIDGVMKEIVVATEALEVFTSREAREYRLIPFEVKGDELYVYGEKEADYEHTITEVEVLTGRRLPVCSGVVTVRGNVGARK